MTAELWGVVEIMGHRTRAGRLSDVQIAGATMLRIEHPTVADHTGEEPLTEIYAASAIFAIRPCSREEAAQAAMYWRAPQSLADRPALAPALEDLVDDGVGDDEFDDEPFDVEVVR